MSVLTRMIGALLAAVFLTLFGAVAATAQVTGDSPAPVGVDWFAFDNAANIVILVGILIPILTALVTRADASGRVKSLVTLVLMTVAATIGTIVGVDGDFAFRDFGNAFLSMFVPGIAAYYGLIKPSGLADGVAHKTERFGLLIERKEPKDGDLKATQQQVENLQAEVTALADDVDRGEGKHRE